MFPVRVDDGESCSPGRGPHDRAPRGFSAARVEPGSSLPGLGGDVAEAARRARRDDATTTRTTTRIRTAAPYALSARATERYHDARAAHRASSSACATRRGSSSRAARRSRSISSRPRGAARTCTPATRSSSRDSSITRTLSRGSSSRSTSAPSLRICRVDARTAASTSTISRSLVGPRTKVVAFNHVSNALGHDQSGRRDERDRSACAVP